VSVAHGIMGTLPGPGRDVEVSVGRIPDDDIERVRDATDVVSLISESVQLKQKGRLLWGCCPFHSEKTASFKVDPVSGLWHCFGCGTGGDAIGFVMKTENLEFPDAVRRLAARAHVEIHEETSGMPSGQKERLLAASEEAARFFHERLTKSKDAAAQEAREYLKSRGFSLDVAKRFRLGYAPSSGSPLVDHLRSKGFTSDEVVLAGLATQTDRGALRDRFFSRIMFPIADLSGRTIAFGGRVLGDGRPKYLNSAETPLFHKSSNLYAIDRAKNEIVRSGTSVVVEGYTDVIALHEAGLPYTVATLGTALTEQHVRLLTKFAKRVVYLFDGDDAGMRAARRAEEFLDWQSRPEQEDRTGKAAGRADLRVALIPDGKDPADYAAERGGDALRALVDKAAPLVGFLIEQQLAERDLTSPEGRSEALRSSAAIVSRLADSLLAHDYTNLLADRLRVEYGTVQQAVLDAARSRARERTERRDGETAPAPRPAAPRIADPERVAEVELLEIVARTPSLRDDARVLLDEGVIVDPLLSRLLVAIVQAGGAVGQDLSRKVGESDPELADVVTGVLVSDGDGGRDEDTFRQLAARLREFAVRRRINDLQDRLQRLDPVNDHDEYEEVFRSIVGLRDVRPDAQKTPGARARPEATET
jgi:DNA primase